MINPLQLSPIAGRPVLNNSSEPDDFKGSLMEAQMTVANRTNPFVSATQTEDAAPEAPPARLRAGLANEGFRA
jgi:hypothetical protein